MVTYIYLQNTDKCNEQDSHTCLLLQRDAGWCKALKRGCEIPCEQSPEHRQISKVDRMPTVIGAGLVRARKVAASCRNESGTAEQWLRLFAKQGDGAFFIAVCRCFWEEKGG